MKALYQLESRATASVVVEDWWFFPYPPVLSFLDAYEWELQKLATTATHFQLMSSVIWMSVTHSHPVLLNSLYESPWEGKGVHGRNFTHVETFFLWVLSLRNAGSVLNFLLKSWDGDLIDGLYWAVKFRYQARFE